MTTWLDYLISLTIVIVATLLGGPIGFILGFILVSYLASPKHEVPTVDVEYKAEPQLEPFYRPEIIESVPLSMREAYRDYLKTDEWKQLRYLTFKRDSHRCVRCGYVGDKKQAHHTNYNGIFELQFSIDQLETVCYGDGGCHDAIHRGELPMKKDI